MGELRDPVDCEVQALLRRAVVEHVRAHRGRAVLPTVHVGRPGGPARLFTVRRTDQVDHALRTDAVAAMLGRPEPGRPGPWVWLGRAGDLVVHDLDLQWLAAARTAYAEAGVDLTLVVVTRSGWRDPRSGLSRTWARVRT
jgi:hypothetical protein